MILDRVRQEEIFSVEISGFTGEELRRKALEWAENRFGFLTFFNGNHARLANPFYPYGPFPTRLAAGKMREVPDGPDDPFDTLFRYHQAHPDFWIGFFGYDLKNRIESLSSRHPNRTGFPDLFFYQPVHLIDFDDESVTVRSWENPEQVWEEILKTRLPEPVTEGAAGGFTCRVSRDDYLKTVEKIRQHILDGDVYELNYCIEFFRENARIRPADVYRHLNERSPMPFSVYQKTGNRYLIGASPERFLRKERDRLISQPIKGTIRRGRNPEEDQALKEQLRNSRKEQAENLMIVDLVRNDLARSSETGTVQVGELFGIYGFPQVYQMVSTVTGSLKKALPFTEAVRNAFPMGSMTGAPKVRAMELIDLYEASRRGLYSGAAGFITPDGDFDFNVVIRSILYNAGSGYLSFSVGSAITYDAEPQQEYEECLLKAQAILSVL
ncbi:anthranilate synthase component I family protein [Larkinella soli]|uniref:anthranilate synthase component I family protein n=1 Tax=Larkinella soli TaxID=1770527 RepID=UPI000FFB73CA|nr:anthranilate synthase component I family protein [Larkinella soli]